MNERIKQVRRSLGITQQEFAARIGLKQNSIALIESGKRNTSEQVILAICREFKINEDWLRYGNGKMLKPDPATELDALAKKFNMSNIEKIFLEKYFKLKKEERDRIFSFMMDVVSAVQDSKATASADAVPQSFLDIDAEVEAYRRQLEVQKKAAEKSYVLNGGNVERENKREA